MLYIIFIMMHSNKIKRFKQSKGCEKSTSLESEQEVIVLPPNLLQQLGINLGHIQNVQENHINQETEDGIDSTNILQNESISSVTENFSISKVQKEPSIIKTASLMKNSILLSPSFLPGNVQREGTDTEISNQELISTKNGDENEICKTNDMQNSDIQLTFKENKNVEDNDLTVNSNDNYKNTLLQTDGIIKEPQELFDMNQIVDDTKNLKSKAKINILSQEIIGVETLSKLKLSSGSKNAFVPFTISTPIPKTKKKTQSNDFKDDELNLTKLQECNNNKKLKISDGSNDSEKCSDNKNIVKTPKNNIENSSYMPDIQINNNDETNKALRTIMKKKDNDIEYVDNTEKIIINTNKLSCSILKKSDEVISYNKNVDSIKQRQMIIWDEKNGKIVEDNIILNDFENIGNKTIQRRSSVHLNTSSKMESAEILEDKVKEIASYLNQCLLPENKNISSRRFLTKSKLSIQGVEKPGGTIIKSETKPVSKVIKTYQNKKTANKHDGVVSNKINNMATDETNQINLNVSYPYLHCLVEQFCVCKDFGRLKLYDFESEYPHIHFLNNNSVGITFSTLFEIYNEHSSFTFDNEVIDQMESTITSQELYKHCNMCYTDYSLSDSDIDLDNCVKNLTDFSQNTIPEIMSSDTLNKDFICDTNNILECENKIIKSATQMKTQYSNSVNQSDVLYRYLSSENALEDINSSEFIPNYEGIIPYQSQNYIHETANKKRRRSSIDFSNDEENNVPISKYKKSSLVIKCGICSKELSEVDWETHSSTEHNCIAWKEGQSLDLTNDNILKKITNKIKETGRVKCTFCNFEIRSLKKFVIHTKMCIKVFFNIDIDTDVNDKNKTEALLSSDSSLDIESLKIKGITKCAVCTKEMPASQWLDHIGTEHNYHAWKMTDPPLNLNDEEEMRRYLHNITKKLGGLVCAKCGLVRKYAKAFLHHIKTCDGSATASSSDQLNDTGLSENLNDTMHANFHDNFLTYSGIVRCGVCLKDVEGEEWLTHIQKEHNYLARIEGKPPLDPNNEEAIERYLRQIRAAIGHLVCAKCGLKRKFIKPYLQHVQDCQGDAMSDSNVGDQMNDPCTENMSDSLDANDDQDLIYKGVKKCGVCLKDVDGSEWLDHIGKTHDYLARVEGRPPLSLDNEEEVENHLRRIRSATGHLSCSKCGLERKRIKTYLQHIQSCQETSSPTNANDQVNDTCTSEILNDTSDTDADDDLMYAGVKKCGVCLEDIQGSEWLDHIYKKHNYLARTEGKPPLDTNNEEEVEKHLRRVRSIIGNLTCAKCGLKRKIIKSYLHHVEGCNTKSINDISGEGQTAENYMDASNLDVSTLSGNVECAICNMEVDGSEWVDHIHKEHKYIAWIKGHIPLDVYDEEKVWNYLNNLSKQIGGLTCAKCGLNRKYVKAFLQHVKNCDGTTDALLYNDESNVSLGWRNTSNALDSDDLFPEYVGPIKCGVCGEEMDGAHWLDHIQKEHNYVAWVEGKPPLNIYNEEEIRQHLYTTSKQIGGLICPKCGRNRKYVKTFLQHIKTCDGTTDNANDNDTTVNEEENDFVFKEAVKCGVCGQDVTGEEWIEHIHKHHDYLARIADRPQLNLDDEDEIRRHLTSLKKYVFEFVCTKCGQARKFVKAYLRHIRNCDGSEGPECEGGMNDTYNSEFNLDEGDIFFTGTITCAVCKIELKGEDWLKHAQKEHNYLAWVDGKPPLDVDDEQVVRQHLYKITKLTGGLVCSKCGLNRKYVKSYLQHLKNCDGKVADDLDSERIEEDIPLVYTGTVKCGVCQAEVEGEQWMQHIQKEHNYMARVEGKPQLNLKDVNQVQRHLYAVAKHTGGLVCVGCGITRMYVKSYLRHLQNCASNTTAKSIDPELFEKLRDTLTIDNVNDTAEVASLYESEFVYSGTVECGVCHMQVEGAEWPDHIQKEHNYLARIEGKEPLDLENKFEEVQTFLYAISKMQNGLTCKTCGVKRKYVKLFLQHIESCTTERCGTLDKDNKLECAICSEKVSPHEWRMHSMRNHYNIAWAVGMEPIDLKNPYAVEKYLKDYKQQFKNLVCKICKTSRVSYSGFYAHLITCGKTEEEMESYKSFCTICNCKYLCIYKNQHLAMHREQEYARERKLRLAEETLNKQQKSVEEDENNQGRRKAAQKAKTVIENYKTSMNQCSHKCTSCGFATDIQRELDEHKCEVYNDLTDSEGSVHYDAQTEDESESDVDSNVSNEEEEQLEVKKKRPLDPSLKIQRLSFKVNSASNYVAQAAVDFFNTHYTTDVLFPNWRTCEYQELTPSDISKYLPPLEESCKVKIAAEGWTTYKRFEGMKSPVCSAFVGGCVCCMAWAPARGARSVLCVSAHGADDAPRLPATCAVAHPALLQLWDFAEFNGIPKFALGIAHDFGTVWAMDWCPSGARDCPPEEGGGGGGGDEGVQARLGLLAIACSDGGVYVLVVPYPRTDDKEAQVIKIKPAVELRLCSGEARTKYQATAISWSQQKGHSVVLVGYSDGTTAFYDLNCDSPFLKSVEDGVTILHPFQDDRPHNTCILDVELFPEGMMGAEGDGGWGAACAAACTGVRASLRPPAPSLHSPLATARAAFTPHWPSVLVTADEAIANHTLNELEWQGGGRRLGGQRALASCARCGLGVVFAPPVLRCTRAHPAHRDPRRDLVGFLRMAPLAKKRSKHVNDELSMKVEPLTYQDAIKEYGIELKLKCHMDKGDQQLVYNESKQHYPERFPLADVAAMAFCPAPARHGKLALAAHAGLLFVLNI